MERGTIASAPRRFKEQPSVRDQKSMPDVPFARHVESASVRRRSRRRTPGVAASGCLVLLLVSATGGLAQSWPEPPPLPRDPELAPEAPARPLATEMTAAGLAAGTPVVSLSAAVRLALQGNFSLLGDTDAVESARLREIATRADFLPKLQPRYLRSPEESAVALDVSQKLPWTGGSLQAAALVRSAPDVGTPVFRSSDLRLVFTQPLLRGFGPTATSFALANSRRSREGQERSFELGRQRLAVQVAGAFYQVVKQRQLLAVAAQSLERSQGLRESSEARMRVGLASKLDVLRAELQGAQAQEAMVAAQAGLETALERFRILLGRAPDDPLEPDAVALPDVLEAEEEPLPALVERAHRGRLDLRESEDSIDDARRSATVARQSLLPQLDVGLSLARVGFGPTMSDAFRAADHRLSLFVTTSYPVERTADRANRALAELELQGRERGLRERRLEVEAEVRAAAREMARIRKSAELQKKALELAAQQHRLATLRYQRGLASNFDVVDAEGALVSARTALVGLLTDYRVARIDLRRVTGELDVEKEFGP